MSAVKKEDIFMTSQEMLDRSSSWTLACDNALLNRLKKFSEDLTRNSQDILKECDTLSRDVTQLDYRLINVSNEFLMLSNTQFVENRVEEFEEFSSSVSSSTVTPISKTKSEKEAALLSKMKQAIQLGYTACSDRRNESSTNRFKLKQPYLIGSPKFFSSKYCGLVDESRRQVPIYEDPIDMDSVSIGQSNDMYIPSTSTQGKPEVKFTMPPTPVFPIKAQGVENPRAPSDNRFDEREEKVNYDKPIFPPSPTNSDRSSEITAGSVSSVTKDNPMPRSVTDELNKIYGNFAPPPAADDDSDDDFRPSAGVGRIFDDDDDDIFGEKELFPSNQKKTNFFGRENPSQLPAPVFSDPPPINPVPQSKTTINDTETLVGAKPKPNDSAPNMNRVTRDIPNNEDLIREPPPPETAGPSCTKLPPGAVSPFGSYSPPVFNNGTLQAAPTASKVTPSSVSKPDTQISSHSSVGSGLAPTFNRDNNVVVSSHKREDVHQKSVTSQPSHNVAAPGRTKNNTNSQGSLSGDVGSKPKPTQQQAKVVPVSSLFADDSSDEDIFMSNKKQAFSHPKTVVPSRDNPPIITPVVTKPVTVSNTVKTTSSKKVNKAAVKKSIFDDSDSEDDIFNSKPSFSRPENRTVSAKANDNLFKPETKKATVPIKVSKTKSLFGDDSDSDTDLFGNKKKIEGKSGLKTSLPKATPKMEEVNAESFWDQEDLFKAPAQQQAGEVPVKAGVNNNNNDNVEETISNEKPVIQSNSGDSISIISKSTEIAPEEPKEKERAIKKSIFDDSESDDDLFSSKSSSSTVAKKSDSAPSIFDQKRSVPSLNANKGKRSSLFGDDSDSDSDLFGGKDKNKTVEKFANSMKNDVGEKELSSSENIAKKDDTAEIRTSQQNSDEPDATTAQASESKEDIPDACDENTKENEPKSTKAIGSKISAKIKAMQTTKIDISQKESTESSNKKQIKSKVNVKSLALNLNINPLALKVGAKPPKPGGSTPGTPEKEASNSPPVDEPTVNDISSSNDKPDTDEIIKDSKVNVKSLALNLKINPLALKVGAKRPKPGGSTPGTPEKEASNSPPVDEPSVNDVSSSRDKPEAEENIKDSKLDNGEDTHETASDNTDPDDKQKNVHTTSMGKALGVDELVGILKARVKIQKKRRPPSRNLLKSLAVREEKEEDNQDESQNEQKDSDNKEKQKEEKTDSNHIKEEENHDTEEEFE